MLALILLWMPQRWRDSVAELVRATVLSPVLAMQRGALEREARLADPVRLRAERDSLAAFLVGTAALQAENESLRALLGLRQRLPPSFVSAELVRVPERGAEGAFRLTAGGTEGVQPGAPVVAAAGLVGAVNSTDARGAVGIDWTHPLFRASAMTLDGNVYGIVEPRTGPNGAQMLALTGTAFHTELPRGTLIVTSGRGGVYPRGIPIGTIAGRDEQQVAWSPSYLVTPLVTPGEMSYVLVLGQPDPALAGRNLAASWGITVAEHAAVDTAAIGAVETAPARAPAAAPRVVVPQVTAPAAPAVRPQIRTQPVQPAVPAARDTGTAPEGRR